MAPAAVTSIGQIAIHTAVTKKLGLKPGGRVRFGEGENGEFILNPKTRSIMGLKKLARNSGKPMTIEEMNETIAKGPAGEPTCPESPGLVSSPSMSVRLPGRSRLAMPPWLSLTHGRLVQMKAKGQS